MVFQSFGLFFSKKETEKQDNKMHRRTNTPLGPREGGTPRVGARRVGGPKFRAFFSSLATISLFLCLSGCLLVEFWWCLKHWDPRAQTCTFYFPAFKNTTNIQREDTQRDRKRAKWWREREKIAKCCPFRRSRVQRRVGPAEGGSGKSKPTTTTTTPTHHQKWRVEAKPRRSVAQKGEGGWGEGWAPKGRALWGLGL